MNVSMLLETKCVHIQPYHLLLQYYRCNFINFSRNIVCKKCKASGPGAQANHQLKEGDWECPRYCHAHCPGLWCLCMYGLNGFCKNG